MTSEVIKVMSLEIRPLAALYPLPPYKKYRDALSVVNIYWEGG
jgi:hypothetical protein